MISVGDDGAGRVSVVIPAYNAERYVGLAIESALRQIQPPLEVIVVDDGSTDGTHEVIAGFGAAVRSLRIPHGERSTARNAAIDAAQGDWLAFLDADDEWLPDKLERQMAALTAYPEAVLAFCSAVNIDADGDEVTFAGSRFIGPVTDEVGLYVPGDELLLGNTVTAGGSTAIALRAAIRSVGAFDPGLHRNEDWDLWWRLSRVGPFVRVAAPLARRRTYGWEREQRLVASPELAEHRCQLIDKAAASDSHAAALWERAMATAWVDTAVARFHLGDGPGGCEAWATASALNPALAGEGSIRLVLEDHARRIWANGDGEAAVRRFLETALRHLPAGCTPPRGGVRSIVSRVYMADAFQGGRAEQQGPQWRRALWRGVVNDPSWVRNRGVLALLARMLIPDGRTAAGATKHLD